MTDRSDHLIERAAALLRSANAGHVVEPALPPIEPQQPLISPARPGAASSRNGAAAGGTPPPRWVPPPRPVAPVQLTQPDPAAANRPRSALTPGGSVADLRKLSKYPAITLATLEGAGLMVARASRTRTTEEYRIVIGRVLRALNEDQELDAPLGAEASANVVMITSARPGEGKSFTALNLGGSIAQNAGESVLIVDVDAKDSSITDQLGANDHPGFLDMVARPDLSPDELIIPTELPNLSFLPRGSRSLVREGDAVALEERRLTPPIRRIAKRFPTSLILLDAPPCLSTSDPHTLAPVVGQVVVVVEAERTQRSEVEGAIDLIKVCPNLTMLLNKVRMNTGHTFGSYDYFGSYT